MGVVRGTAARLGSAPAAPAVPAPAALHHPIGLMHTSVRHRTPTELASLLTPFIHEALQVNDPVYVSLPPSGLTALEAELGRDATGSAGPTPPAGTRTRCDGSGRSASWSKGRSATASAGCA